MEYVGQAFVVGIGGGVVGALGAILFGLTGIPDEPFTLFLQGGFVGGAVSGVVFSAISNNSNK
jgi:hypothetical protein